MGGLGRGLGLEEFGGVVEVVLGLGSPVVDGVTVVVVPGVDEEVYSGDEAEATVVPGAPDERGPVVRVPAPVPPGTFDCSDDGVASAPAIPEVRWGISMMPICSSGWAWLSAGRPVLTRIAAALQPSTTAIITRITHQRDLDFGGTWWRHPSRTSISATDPASSFTRNLSHRGWARVPSYRKFTHHEWT